MTYRRFEDLPVWVAAITLADRIYDLTEDRILKPSLRDQLERAALSIANNTAEGFERGTTKELLTFLYIARGSAGEMRSMLCFIERRNAYAHLKPRLAELKALAESCSRQLRSWAESLQNSPIRGQRYLNDPARRSAAQSAEAAETPRHPHRGLRRADAPSQI